MIVKGEIISIDFSSNTCQVRLPLFESANSDQPAIAPAIFSITPGFTNSYLPGDVVMIAFEDGELAKPVVLGKLYLESDNDSARGAVKVDSLDASEASLPVTTKLVYPQSKANQNDSPIIGIYNNTTNYTSFLDIIQEINNLKVNNNTHFQKLHASTVICNSLIANLYGYTAPGFSVSEKNIAENCYYVKYNNREVLTTAEAAQYMLYMTGYTELPEQTDYTKYNIAFITITHKIYYPVWDPINKHLKLIIINDESLEDLVKRIIAESGTPILVTDLSYGPTATNISGQGIHTTDATTEAHSEISSNIVTVEDLT